MRFAVTALLMLFVLVAPALPQDEAPPVEPQSEPAAVEPAGPALEILPVEVVTFHPVAIQYPADYDPAQSYPLVIGLHGFGSNAERFLTNFNAFANPQFIYAVPQAPYISPQPDYIGYSWILFDTGNLEMEFQTMQNSIDYVLQVEELVRQRANVSETYLLGFSQGGTLAYRLALAHPDQYAGLAAIAAPLDEYYATPDAMAALAGLRLFIAHGTDDDALPIDYSIAARDAFIANGNDVEYFEYEGKHSFDAAVLQLIEDWILNRET
jgi:predicted esterase